MIDHSANYILMEFLSRGLVKGVDKGKVFDHLKRKLYELWKKIKESKIYKRLEENSVIPIVQKDGTIVLKKAGGHDVRSINSEIKKYVEHAKKKPLKNIKLPEEDKAVIHHSIETFGFSELEIFEGFAVRFSANYGVIIRIYDGNIEKLMYTIIKKWRLK